MDINVNNLDLGYDQSSEIHNLIMTDGKNLLDNLETNITNINNLIIVYKALGALLSDGKVTISAAANRISAIQRVRNANAGGTGNVGDELDKSEMGITEIANVEPTDQYFVEPTAATDLTDLTEVCSKFEKFATEFTSRKDELLSNWTAGADRETAVKLFNDFSTNSDEYNTYLKNAESELGKAVANIQKL